MTPAFPLLHGVAPETVNALAHGAVERSFAAGSALYARGAPAREVLAVRSGRVKIWRSTENGTTLALTIHMPGDIVGLVAAVRRKPFSVNATAIVPVEAVVWRMSLIDQMVARDARLALNLNRLLARRVDMMVERMEELAPASVEQRIARVLLRFARELGHDRDGGPIHLPLSGNDVAELARTTAPTVSRVMGRWRVAGLVDGRRGEVVLRDREGIAAISHHQD